MDSAPQFGGEWTKQKLTILRGYLQAYTTIFHANPKARYFETYYVDAFAGSGHIGGTETVTERSMEQPLLEEFADADMQSFIAGSANVALEVEPPFHRYLFIEKSARYCERLQKLCLQYPMRAIQVRRGDSNNVLRRWTETIDWTKTRAVVFLDPYGMQVDWQTISVLGATRGVDLWFLFPISAILRSMPRDGEPPIEWGQALTRVFGTDQWKSRFYRTQPGLNLAGLTEVNERAASAEEVGNYLVERLGMAFHAVHQKPRPLLNRNKTPLYLLVFAAGNEAGARPAMKIAGHLLNWKHG